MSSLVIDASITISWLVPDEHGAGQRALHRVGKDGAQVPGIWPLEVANTLIVAERRGRISPAARAAALRILAALPIAIDPATAAQAWTTTLHLADKFRLTVYDAAYLELAQRLSLPLATLDAELMAAAEKCGIGLLGT